MHEWANELVVDGWDRDKEIDERRRMKRTSNLWRTMLKGL